MACLFWVMPMFSNILVAIDGSKASDKAIEQAIDEAKAWNARLHAVYVIETGLFTSLPSDNTVELMYRALENEGNAVLEKAKKTAAIQGILLTPHLKQGHAGSEVLAVAAKEKADLIVSGSHGKSRTDSILLGSVSTYITTHSPVTTMVVRL